MSRAMVTGRVPSLWRRAFPKRGAVVLYAHRVSADDDGYLPGILPRYFDAQLEYLTRTYRILALSELLECYEEEREVPWNSIVITLDDGFRDNYDAALPIFRRYGIQPTVFLTTGCVSTGSLPWPQRIGWAVQRTSASEVTHRLLGARPVRLHDAPTRRGAFLRIFEVLLDKGREERETCLGELEEALEVESPRDRMLTWDQAREMTKSGVEFGGHTVTHPWLALQTKDEAQWEIEQSRRDIERELGVERPPFAFPGGSHNEDLVGMVRKAGYRGVFRSRPGRRVNNLETTGPFDLSRLGLPNAPAYILEAELDGPFHAVRRLYRR